MITYRRNLIKYSDTFHSHLAREYELKNDGRLELINQKCVQYNYYVRRYLLSNKFIVLKKSTRSLQIIESIGT